MKCIIRCDFSHSIGHGHIVRCLALADRLKLLSDWEIIFLSIEYNFNLLEEIRRDYQVYVPDIKKFEVAQHPPRQIRFLPKKG